MRPRAGIAIAPCLGSRPEETRQVAGSARHAFGFATGVLIGGIVALLVWLLL